MKTTVNHTEILARYIDMISDDGTIRLRGRMEAIIDGYRLVDASQFYGSHWVGGFYDRKGHRLPYVMSTDGCPISFSEWGCGLCQHGVRLTKNTLLYGAILTGKFTKATDGMDVKKIARTWTKEYVQARIRKEQQAI